MLALEWEHTDGHTHTQDKYRTLPCMRTEGERESLRYTHTYIVHAPYFKSTCRNEQCTDTHTHTRQVYTITLLQMCTEGYLVAIGNCCEDQSKNMVNYTLQLCGESSKC